MSTTPCWHVCLGILAGITNAAIKRSRYYGNTQIWQLTPTTRNWSRKSHFLSMSFWDKISPGVMTSCKLPRCCWIGAFPWSPTDKLSLFWQRTSSTGLKVWDSSYLHWTCRHASCSSGQTEFSRSKMWHVSSRSTAHNFLFVPNFDTAMDNIHDFNLNIIDWET